MQKCFPIITVTENHLCKYHPNLLLLRANQLFSTNMKIVSNANEKSIVAIAVLRSCYNNAKKSERENGQLKH